MIYNKYGQNQAQSMILSPVSQHESTKEKIFDLGQVLESAPE